MKFEVGVRVVVRGRVKVMISIWVGVGDRVRVRNGVRGNGESISTLSLSQFARNRVNSINLLLAIYTVT